MNCVVPQSVLFIIVWQRHCLRPLLPLQKNSWQQMSLRTVKRNWNPSRRWRWCITCASVSFILFRNLSCALQLNSLHSELANQMADSMVFPLMQFREKDLTGRITWTNAYHNVHFQACFWGYFMKVFVRWQRDVTYFSSEIVFRILKQLFFQRAKHKETDTFRANVSQSIK